MGYNGLLKSWVLVRTLMMDFDERLVEIKVNSQKDTHSKISPVEELSRSQS